MTSVEEIVIIVGVCVFWIALIVSVDYYLEKNRKWGENE